MKRPTLLLSSILLVLLAEPTFSASLSYVVLQAQGSDMLRVSADGKTVTTIAENVGGLDLAIDANGSYIITTGSQLMRVSRSGEVSVIAKAPQGASWVAIAAARDGSTLVADESSHAVWQVSENAVIRKVATYPGSLSTGDSYIGLLIDASDNCLVMRISDDNSPELFRISMDGAVSVVTLTGRIRKPTSRSSAPIGVQVAISGGPLIEDGEGGYLFLDCPWTKNIFRMSRTGKIDRLFTLPEPAYHGKVFALNPETMDLIVGGLSRLLIIHPDGSSDSFSLDRRLEHITAIVLDHCCPN